eukprot:gene3787-7521_t
MEKTAGDISINFRRPLSIYLLLNLIQFSFVNSFLSIDTFGAIANDFSSSAAETNSIAILSALQAADISIGENRTVLIPAFSTYFIDAVFINVIHSVTIKIDGNLVVNTDMNTWDETTSVFYFVVCNFITITGSGSIDAKGWYWWDTVNRRNQDIKKPLAIIDVRVSYGLLIEDITLINSPQSYIYIYDVKDIIIRNIIIKTDPVSPTSGSVTFPINTDGIILYATNATIYNLVITTYDDAISIKPCKSIFKYCDCASDINISNIVVNAGFGMAIGAVAPSSYHSCVRNVKFENIIFNRPFKGIYIKTYSGYSGTGEITNITYTNIRMYNTLWWPIYIGPLQQEELDEIYPTCLRYPVDALCVTQAAISINNIFLNDVIALNTWSYFHTPGIIRCDQLNPCKNIIFNNVKILKPRSTNNNNNNNRRNSKSSSSNSKLQYTEVENIFFSKLGESTYDYDWRYIVENIQGASICSIPTFEQTLPLPEINMYNPTYYNLNSTINVTTCNDDNYEYNYGYNDDDNMDVNGNMNYSASWRLIVVSSGLLSMLALSVVMVYSSSTAYKKFREMGHCIVGNTTVVLGI